MLLDLKKLTAIAAVCVMATTVVAQETAQITTQPANPATTATLSADGQLTGNVITANADQITQVPNAKVSLVSQGKVIDSVTADATGNFSFANVHPGPYQLVGTAAGMLGSNALTVAPFAKSQPITPGRVMLQPSTPQVMYDSYSSAPVASLSSGCSSCNTCAGGGSIGGGYGGGIGSRLGGARLGGRLLGGSRGGLLSTPRGWLVAGGVAAGVAAIADSSPDN